MGKRGPKPKGTLKALPTASKPISARPDPFTDMSTRAKKLWRDIVQDCAVDHFKAGDLPLLREYCEAYDISVMAKNAIKRNGVISVQGQAAFRVKNAAANTMKGLAQKMRLCASSRYGGYKPDAYKGDKPKASNRRKNLMFNG